MLQKFKIKSTDIAYLLMNNINWDVAQWSLGERYQTFAANSHTTVSVGLCCCWKIKSFLGYDVSLGDYFPALRMIVVRPKMLNDTASYPRRLHP